MRSPKKPAVTRDRIRECRGGTWVTSITPYLNSAYYWGFRPEVRYNSIGFRLTQSGCRLPLKGGVTP